MKLVILLYALGLACTFAEAILLTQETEATVQVMRDFQAQLEPHGELCR